MVYLCHLFQLLWHLCHFSHVQNDDMHICDHLKWYHWMQSISADPFNLMLCIRMLLMTWFDNPFQSMLFWDAVFFYPLWQYRILKEHCKAWFKNFFLMPVQTFEFVFVHTTTKYMYMILIIIIKMMATYQSKKCRMRKNH